MNGLKWEPLSVNHAGKLPAPRGDNDVIRYTAVPALCSLEQIRSRVNSLSTLNALVTRMEGEAMGIVGCIHMDRPGERCEVFYQLKKIFWGRGFTTRAVEQLLIKMREESPSAVLYANVVMSDITSEEILRRFHLHYISVEEDGSEWDSIKRAIREYRL